LLCAFLLALRPRRLPLRLSRRTRSGNLHRANNNNIRSSSTRNRNSSRNNSTRNHRSSTRKIRKTNIPSSRPRRAAISTS
jgi:hypothetical protein